MLQPDLVLLDVALPGIGGIEATRRIRAAAPLARILFFTHESGAEVVQEALQAGARGYVLKVRAANDLLPALQTVLRGEIFVSAGLEGSARFAGQETGSTGDQTARSMRDGSKGAVASGTGAHDRHKVLFCSDGAQMIEAMVRTIARALGEGNPAIAVVAGSRQQEFHRRLLAEGADLRRAIERGTYALMDADQPKAPGQWATTMAGVIDAARADKLSPRLTIVGERSGRLWACGEIDDAIKLERLGQELANTKDVVLLCVYEAPRDAEDEMALEAIRELHTSAHTL